VSDSREHPYIPRLKQQLADGRIDRREFLRSATLLGLSAGAAYAFAGKVDGIASPAMAAQATAMPRGGTLRISMRVQEVTDPHTFSWIEPSNIARQVVEFLAVTGHDNITRPWLAERWEASEDLKTWTFHLRRDVTWRNGRRFTADDVVWNLKRVLDPETKSSMLGLMMGYLMDDAGKALWDANAIEKVDDFTVRLNCKVPQLAVPEHLFHYPMFILDPEEGGRFGPGANGTGAFELTEIAVSRKAVLKARKDGYWAGGPFLDGIEFIDLGDDPAADIGALASRQVHGLYSLAEERAQTVRGLDHLELYDVLTAFTAVARVKVTEKPFDDPRVRKALRLAIDQDAVLAVALQGIGQRAEHHHVCPIHPAYAELPFMGRDVEEAKRLLAEAGYPDGFETEIFCKKDPSWEPIGVQAMVEMWKEIGVRVKINLLPSAQYWDVWTEVPFGFTTWSHRPLGIMVLGLAYRSGTPWNESGYSNPEFDRLLTEAEGLLDVEARREVMAKLQRIMQEDGPIVQPVWRKLMTAYDKRVKGFRMHPSAYIFGHEIALAA